MFDELNKIDFLKIDYKGSEYQIFNDDNFEWIKNNVKQISGKFYLNTQEEKKQFRKFRDTYLKEFTNYEVFSIDNVDIKWSVWEDWFIERYAVINLHIDNNFSDKKPLSNSPQPTIEFTTSINSKNGCVVDCVFCPQRTLQRVYKGEEFMSLDNFKKTIDKIPQEIRITFAGFT